MPHSLYRSKWAPTHRSSEAQSLQQHDRPIQPHNQITHSRASMELSDSPSQQQQAAKPGIHQSLPLSNKPPRKRARRARNKAGKPSSQATNQPSHQCHTQVDRTLPSQSEQDLCPICQDPPNDAVWTPCVHVFCHDCLASWLKDNDTCPTCRLQCTYDDVFSETLDTQESQAPLTDPIRQPPSSIEGFLLDRMDVVRRLRLNLEHQIFDQQCRLHLVTSGFSNTINPFDAPANAIKQKIQLLSSESERYRVQFCNYLYDLERWGYRYTGPSI